MENIQEEIFKFVSTHESIISREFRNTDREVRFTTFGNRAACRAIKDIIELVDNETKLKIIEMMKNK